MKHVYVDSDCDFMSVRVQDVDEAVWSWIRNLLEHPELIRNILAGTRQKQQQEGEDFQQRIADIDELIQQHTTKMSMYANEVIEERMRAKNEGRDANDDVIAAFKHHVDDLAEHIKALKARRTTYLAQLEEKVVSRQYIEDRVHYAERLAGKLDAMTFSDKREVIQKYGWAFEFEQKSDNPRTVVVHLQWLIWEYELTVNVTSRQHAPQAPMGRPQEADRSPSESSPS